MAHTVAAARPSGGSPRYSTSVGAIVSANSLSNANLIRIGQRLTVPAGTGGGTGGTARPPAPTPSPAPATAVPASPGTHVVVRGDTLNGIARRYGVTAEALAAANGILPPWNLYAGRPRSCRRRTGCPATWPGAPCPARPT